MSKYKRNHYVPEWYQSRFFSDENKDRKFHYLDLKPESMISNGHRYKRKNLLRWGSVNCFCENDLYTTNFSGWESTEIEQKFFGNVDSLGLKAVDYFSNFQHPSADPKMFNSFLQYMSIQKLRTPKGLAYLSSILDSKDKNYILHKLQELQQMFCALWTESVWSIVDATESQTKFIITDHPVTTYNKKCFPASKWCGGYSDPDIWLSGTHTIFPLSMNKLLILTNLSWVRNPYDNGLKPRPNPNLFRGAVFNFMQIQTHRMLSDIEVNEINFILKQRAYRYISATEKDWLYPEKNIPSQFWNKLGNGYLLMPDPRSVTFSSETLFGYENGGSDAFDEYGRKPWQKGYKSNGANEKEWISFHAFQGEFARVFGPKRRGVFYEFGSLEKLEDTPDYHKYHLKLEQQNKSKMNRSK